MSETYQMSDNDSISLQIETAVLNAVAPIEAERDSLKLRLDEALSLIEEARKQEPIAWFIFNEYGGWQQLSKEFWGKTGEEGLQDMKPLYAKPPIASVPEGMVKVEDVWEVIHCDLENGIKCLNEEAANRFNREFTNLIKLLSAAEAKL